MCLLILLAISVFTHLPPALGIQQTQNYPADYLVPPPLPTPQHLKHQKAPALQAVESVAASSQSSSNVAEPSGFMTRIARWFGLGAAEQNQLANGFASTDSKQAYNYPQPLGPDGKPCNLCNKYPWVPMFPHGLQLQAAASANNHYVQKVPQQQSHQQLEAQASQKYLQQQALPFGKGSQQLPVKQRAVQFNFPTAYQPKPGGAYQAPAANAPAALPFLPIPIPNLNLAAAPPIYNAQPFRLPYLTPAASTTTTTTAESVLNSEQQLPSTEPAHFAENLGAPSELQPDHVRPEQMPATPTGNSDASVEIVKSHQLTDFVSSVEYPITYEQSPSIDLGQQHTQSNQQPDKDNVATVPYQHQTLSPNLHKHLPASQLLTELGSFGGTQQTQSYQDTQPNGQTQYQAPQSQQQTQAYQQPDSIQKQVQFTHHPQLQQHFSQHTRTNEPSTTFYTTPYMPQTQYQHHNSESQRVPYESQGEDNYPSASSHNLTEVQHQQLNQDYKAWLPLAQTFPYTTTELPREYELSTQLAQLGEVDYITERAQHTTQVQFSPSLQTQIPQRLQKIKHDGRDTPKRLLDSPIRHAGGSQNQPRPFTRDPSELNLRLPPESFVTPVRYHNHKHSSVDASFSTAPWLVTPLPPLPANTGAPAAPTPTSTYTSIDASGQYAGISPPTPPPPARHREVHQIIVPYTTKNKPRPFEPTRTVTTNTQNTKFQSWSAQQNIVDIHEQQESKVVSAQLATEAPPPQPPRRTTKYITKILASNLRDLLRREHEVGRNKSNLSSFDFTKLQKNIDDWTEQEYTSLSHRPSTPTIRGRSKHIPTEYLTTTTPSPRRSKTTINFFEQSSLLPASVNELQALLLERGSKRFELNQIDDEVDNHLLDTLGSETATVATVTTSRATTQHPQNSNGHAAPNFMHLNSEFLEPEPAELWRKAQVSISPQTHERVYVVTPQPLFFPQRALTTTSTTTQMPLGVRKAPRFLVRPTPGNGTNSSTPVSSSYSPELFGLTGLSAYVPAKPVEIIDGNSKVFNIITTAQTNEHEEDITSDPRNFIEPLSMVKKSRRRLRSTMSPSPR